MNIKNSNQPGNKSIQKIIILLIDEYVIAKIFADQKSFEKKHISTWIVSDRDKRVQYEISHWGYVTADDELALTNYLVHLPSKNYVLMNIDVDEELNERVNGGELDDVGDNAI